MFYSPLEDSKKHFWIVELEIWMEISYFEFLQFRKSFLLHSRQEVQVKETLSCEKYPSLKMPKFKNSTHKQERCVPNQ